MAKYQQYEQYKESGVEWLGNIPSHWEVVPIKHLAILNPKKSTLSQDLMFDECSFVPMEKLKFNSLVLDEKKVIKDVYDGYTYFENEDILVAKVTPCFENNNTTIAKDLINGVGFGSSEIFVLRVNNKVNNRYLFYRLLETIFISVATAAMTGAGGLRRVPAETINTYPIAVPNINEQIQIANFLDHETAQIDTLIDKQQTLIQLLKEKRQAVISHAVTKGLNPDAPMKDSCVEWLGEVPEGWDVGRLKNVLRIRNGRDYKEVEVESGGYPVYGSGGIFKRSSDYLFDGESVLFGRKGTIDKPLLVSGKFWTVDTMFYSEVSNNAKPEYVYHQALLFPFDKLSTNTALPSMTQEDLLNLGFVIPPFDEQKEICQYLSNKLNVFSNLVSKAEQTIQLMQERRTALISAAVTGKIDVRGWVATE
ncbi:restriction endonuclease subunit S [Psychrobacter sp. NG25]|uniref:restriction endonuclease subunit S n=1 Tax=Psychrobacter sp. NG25 TaxID=2782005 RepID=UPI0018848698|nr:restriction endonuclease subunit S [Psychrobacter sp. NG25]MBF0657793.1 restriction endonuclease subunit S [Psychrobacter sp. NG25]